MEENYLKKSFTLVAMIIGILLLISAFPQFNVGSLKIKKVNLLADILADPPPAPVKKDTAQKKTVQVIPITNSCMPGVTCFEDFSTSGHSTNAFFAALREVRRKPVRIAFFGDSFIEADILCSSFRDTLQALYGGQGVGFMPITSEVAQYRSTIQHSFMHWKTYSIVGEKNRFSPPGTSGYCFVPLEGNEVEYKPAKKSRNVQFRKMKIFYQTAFPATLRYVLNDTSAYVTELAPSDTLQEFVVPQTGAWSVKFQFAHDDSTKIYGASIEDAAGVYVDNFSMRGNSGMGLYQVESRKNKEFNRLRDYKLILLQYGLNVVSENDSTGYGWYIDRMITVINKLKENFPASSIVLIGVSDRSSNQDGKFATMPNILLMRDAQREIAMRTHIAFWDLYTAMGGKNSMVKYVNAIPPMAAKDYTHLNYSGGRKLAKKLADALLFERHRYDTKKNIRH